MSILGLKRPFLNVFTIKPPKKKSGNPSCSNNFHGDFRSSVVTVTVEKSVTVLLFYCLFYQPLSQAFFLGFSD